MDGYHVRVFWWPIDNLSTSIPSKDKMKFVPAYKPPLPGDVEMLREFVNTSRRLLVVTGAGVSTESGIPDYRSEAVGLYQRAQHKPVQYQDFVADENIRQRYWARNFVGWPAFSSKAPNSTHHTLARWEKHGRYHWLITQNVDRLHQSAGSSRLTELHGTTYLAECMRCRHKTSRARLQERMEAENEAWVRSLGAADVGQLAPDGDVTLSDRVYSGFTVPGCDGCGARGLIKPCVVFFGDSVPKKVVDECYEKVDECDAMLTLGTSLHVYSVFRFVSRLTEQGKPLAIVNIGPTRADEQCSVKVDSLCSLVVAHLALDTAAPRGETTGPPT